MQSVGVALGGGRAFAVPVLVLVVILGLAVYGMVLLGSRIGWHAMG